MKRDGQFHKVRFTVNPPAIDAVSDTGAAGVKTIEAGDAEASVTVKGSGFQPGCTALWTPPGAATPSEIPAGKVQFVANTQSHVRPRQTRVWHAPDPNAQWFCRAGGRDRDLSLNRAMAEVAVVRPIE